MPHSLFAKLVERRLPRLGVSARELHATSRHGNLNLLSEHNTLTHDSSHFTQCLYRHMIGRGWLIASDIGTQR